MKASAKKKIDQTFQTIIELEPIAKYQFDIVSLERMFYHLGTLKRKLNKDYQI